MAFASGRQKGPKNIDYAWYSHLVRVNKCANISIWIFDYMQNDSHFAYAYTNVRTHNIIRDSAMWR